MNLDDFEFSEISSLQKEGIKEEVMNCASEKKLDFRPRAFCSRTKRSYLVDSGAALSVFPKSALPHHVDLDPAVSLRAVNGTVIPTFGRRTFRLQFGKTHFTHTFTIAPIDSGVLGWDFLSKFRLNWRWQGQKCKLYHNNRPIHLDLAPTKSDMLSLQVA